MTNEQRQTSPITIKRPPVLWLFRLATVSMVIVMLGGCMALLWQIQQGSVVSHAVPAVPAMPADVSVVGPPSLSAATVNAIFTQVGSPMAGTGTTVEALSRQYHIDDAFALGVWYTETNDGEAGVGSADRNPGSVRGISGYPSAWDGYTIYPSYTAAITSWFSLLNSRYVSSGLTTVYSIARPYVGTTSYPQWAGKVINLIYRYQGIAPPPPAYTPTPKPTPKPVPTLSPAMVILEHRLASRVPHDSTSSFVRTSQGLSNETYRTAPAQIATPDAPLTVTQSLPLSPILLNLILFFGLLTALLIALFARRIGRDIPLKVGSIAYASNTAERRTPVLSLVDTEAGLVVSRAAPSAALASNWLPLRSAPMWDVTPNLPISHSGLSAHGITTEALSPLPSLPSTVTTEALHSLPLLPDKQVPESPMKPMRPLHLPAHTRQTDVLPRRTILMPSNATPRIPVTVNTAPKRPAGLLSRYRDEHNP